MGRFRVEEPEPSHKMENGDHRGVKNLPEVRL